MVDLGSLIVGLVGYGIALLLLVFSGLALRDLFQMTRSGIDVDFDGNRKPFYQLLFLGLVVGAAIVAALTRWTLGSF